MLTRQCRSKPTPYSDNLNGSLEVYVLRICHIISGDLWAGAEVMAFNLLRSLQELPEVAVSVLLLNEGRLAEELRALGLDVEVVPERDQSFLAVLRQARAFIRARNPQIIHSHRYKENILAWLCAQGRPPSHLVATQHGLPEPMAGKQRSGARLIAGLNRYALARRFRRVVVVSNNIQAHFVQELGVAAERVRVIHNGLALPEPPPPSGEQPVLVVGSAGRLFPVKDYPLMVDIAQAMTQTSSAVRFELAGEGPERPGLEARIGALALENRFRLRGHLETTETFYRGLDIYLNTSVHEGIPMSILEAMAHGLPVVAPAVGGIGEIIEDGVEGFLISSRDPQAFAAQCLRLQDPELRRSMGRAARAKVERCFSASAMAQNYLRLYRELVPDGAESTGIVR